MSEPLTRDEVLTMFHEYVDEAPGPAEMTWWTRAFPWFADDIRDHALELINMKFRREAAAINETPRQCAVASTAVMIQGRDCAVCGCEPEPIPNCPGCGGVGGFTKVAVIFP